MSDIRYRVDATHVELHDGKSDKFWRSYALEGVWVTQWGPCGAPVGQYGRWLISDPWGAAHRKLQEKMRKGYADPKSRSWEVTEGFWVSVRVNEHLTDLGYQFNQRLGGSFVEPIEDVIADLQGIVASLETR